MKWGAVGLFLTVAAGLVLFLIVGGHTPKANQRRDAATPAGGQTAPQRSTAGPAPVRPLSKNPALEAGITNIEAAPLPTTVAEAIPPVEPGQPSPYTIIENLRTTFRAYASAFGGNPIGTNEEITRALAGENPKQTRFLKETDRVNDRGELVDPWGTPYFLHQLSAREMEIRSAGADRLMWTADDIVLK
jgi:hypothetical protein